MAVVEKRPTVEKRQTITGIERALMVLELFAEADSASLGVTEIANATSLSKAVVHRILSTFRATGFVELDSSTRRYSLGPKVLLLGLNYLDGLDVRELAHETLTALSRQTNETATLSIRSGRTRAYVDQVTPARDVKMVVELGRSFPLHAGSSSKAFLAFLSDEDIDEYFREPLERLTERTITSGDVLRGELETIREQGYAVSLEERRAGAGSVAAPIFGRDARPAAVISVCGPVERFVSEVDAVALALLDATGELSRRLGYRAPAPA